MQPITIEIRRVPLRRRLLDVVKRNVDYNLDSPAALDDVHTVAARLAEDDLGALDDVMKP